MFFYAGLKPAVFAALVPNSADELLGDVIEEIMGDHELLVCFDFCYHRGLCYQFNFLTIVLA